MNIENVDLKMFIEFPGILITIGVILLLISIMIVIYVYVSENRMRKIDALELSNPVSSSQVDVMSEMNEQPQTLENEEMSVSLNDTIQEVASEGNEDLSVSSLKSDEIVSLPGAENDNAFSAPQPVDISQNQISEDKNELFEDMFKNEFKELNNDIQEKIEPKVTAAVEVTNTFDKQENEEEEIELL